MRLLVLLSLLAGTVAAAQPGGAPVRLAVPGRVNATPSIAALGRFVAVAWGATLPESGADVFLGVSRDGGRTFDPPVRVNQRIGEARLGGELPPRVALARRADGDPEIVVAWGAAAAPTTIRVARSTDGGRTFALESAVTPASIAGDRGWHALAVDGSGTAHIVWLDHRGLAARPKATEHDHHGDGAGMAQWSSLYYAALGADGATPGARDLLKGVCYCCKTALATGPSGRLVAAWRHVYPGNIRDIAFAQSLDGGATFSAPARVSEDRWQLAGCPDDGPALAVDAAGTVHIVWPTVIGGPAPSGALFYATTRDGKTFTPRQRVPTLGSPKPGHPQIALDAAGQLVIAWDEVLEGVRRAAVVTASRSRAGMTFGSPRRLAAGSSAYPVLALAADGVVGAWTDGVGEQSAIAIQVAVANSSLGSQRTIREVERPD